MPLAGDRFELPKGTPRSSKTTINIAGVHVYLYGVNELDPQKANDTKVLFYVHGRTRTYADAEAIAHQILHEVKSGSSTGKGFVIATFDNRNHGTRSIDEVAINDWKGGNIRHAQDMLSTIDGTVADIQIVMDHLESYICGLFVPTEYIVSGLSLGGHITWNVLAKDSRVTNGIVIVGSPNLTDLLLERLGDSGTIEEGSNSAKEWPKPVETLYAARDAKIATIKGKNILILNGRDDTLVPSKFTIPWVEKYEENSNVMFIEQEDCGHMLSWQMVDKIVNWLLPLLA